MLNSKNKYKFSNKNDYICTHKKSQANLHQSV